ncbi:hypothetical protein WISP_113571 [Willisornis vidua]|uniref:Uncharacterized protein n=1 Tax=Willisornis vidua TaxID=1566151 RepID=A0ABQ9D0A1_9PASS|nr:hypothetical protein WISP_113571 [Willisornis vidua]
MELVSATCEKFEHLESELTAMDGKMKQPQVTGDPRHPGIPELHSPEAPQPLAAGGLPRPSVSILQPDEWVMLFQKYPCLLDTLIPWVQTRLRQIFMNNWMEAAIVKDTDMDIQSNHVIDENEFTTVTFLQQLICAAVQRCKRQARLLLAQQLHLPAQVPALLRALQAAPRMRSPTPPSLPWVGILADPHLLPLPLLLECKEPQEPKESVPGPSISHWGSEPSPNGHSDPQRHGPAALQLSSQQEDGTAWVTLEDASGIGQIGIGPPAGACASPQRLSALESQLSK